MRVYPDKHTTYKTTNASLKYPPLRPRSDHPHTVKKVEPKNPSWTLKDTKGRVSSSILELQLLPAREYPSSVFSLRPNFNPSSRWPLQSNRRRSNRSMPTKVRIIRTKVSIRVTATPFSPSTMISTQPKSLSTVARRGRPITLRDSASRCHDNTEENESESSVTRNLQWAWAVRRSAAINEGGFHSSVLQNEAQSANFSLNLNGWLHKKNKMKSLQREEGVKGEEGGLWGEKRSQLRRRRRLPRWSIRGHSSTHLT